MQVITYIFAKGFGRSLEKDATERIIDAAIELVSQKGYKAATTKAIAELANVNEITIFRNFGNKRGLLNAIVQKFSYGPVLQKIIQEETIWELEADLYNFSITYQKFMMSIKEFVLISFKEAGIFPEIEEEISKVPLLIKGELMDYFHAMKVQGKLADVDIEATVMALISLNFGYFVSRARLDAKVTDISTDDFLKTSILIFSRGLTP